MSRSLLTVEHAGISQVSGPLLFVEGVGGAAYDEAVELRAPDGSSRRGRILELDGNRAIVEVFTGTAGLDLQRTRVRPAGGPIRLGVGRGLLGRILDGTGAPVDGGPPLLPEALRDVAGAPMNPAVRDHPAEFIETGVSAIDAMSTLVRGQKLPIFSGAGLPASELAARIAAGARVPATTGEDFVVVFAAMGVPSTTASYFRSFFLDQGALWRSVLFLNLADDPSIERLLTPRLALTAAEYLAFDAGLHVLVLLTDMTMYCEALREVGTAREEVPGRRGYPGYMYSDLASIFERAGRIRGRPGSVTQLVILSMPDDDITHPVPDLTGYITEGQIVLSRELHRRGIDPPIDVLPSLSRLMNAGIGAGRTRADHRAVADQLYALYAEGRDLRRLVTIVGEGGLTAENLEVLAFTEDFERRFIHQGAQTRTLDETVERAWELLEGFDASVLKRIPEEILAVRADGSHASSAQGG